MKTRKIQVYMKNKILLILMVLFLFSCDNRYNIEGETIINVELIDENYALYTTYGTSVSLNEENPTFKARKGLYNVGDTLKYSK